MIRQPFGSLIIYDYNRTSSQDIFIDIYQL